MDFLREGQSLPAKSATEIRIISEERFKGTDLFKVFIDTISSDVFTCCFAQSVFKLLIKEKDLYFNIYFFLYLYVQKRIDILIKCTSNNKNNKIKNNLFYIHNKKDNRH